MDVFHELVLEAVEDGDVDVGGGDGVTGDVLREVGAGEEGFDCLLVCGGRLLGIVRGVSLGRAWWGGFGSGHGCWVGLIWWV